MNIVIASDSYKESLTSIQVAKQIKKAFKTVYKEAEYEIVPLADGGEGTVDAFIHASQGQKIIAKVHNPLNKKIKSFYGLIDDGKTAVIEMAASSGLDLIKEREKNPMKTSSYGFGELIEKARKTKIKKMILGLGGSATNDAGIGMLQAMGVVFLDKQKQRFIATAKNMEKISFIDDTKFQKRYKDIDFEIACDVKNILCGKEGATYVFGAQKGATSKIQKLLDNKLAHFAKVCQKHFMKKTDDIEGSGAAGGVGFALCTFLNAKMKSGIDIVIQNTHLEQKIQKADLLITGEGKVDEQTIYGKTIVGVSTLAKKYDVPVIVIAGCTQKGYEKIYDKGVTAVFDITPINADTKTLFKNSKENLYATAKNVASIVNLQIEK